MINIPNKHVSLFPYISSFEEYETLKNQNITVLENAAKAIIAKHQLSEKTLTLFQDGTNAVFAYGNDKVIKIFPPALKEQYQNETLVLNHLRGKLAIEIPTIEYHGEIDGWPYIIMTRVEGTLLEGMWESLDQNNKILLMRELGALIREVHSLPVQGLEKIDCHWQKFIETQIKQCVDQHRAKNLPESLLQQIPKYLQSIENDLYQIDNSVILTGEYTPMNLMVKQIAGTWHICGLIDFGDSMLGKAEYDLLGPGAFLIQGDKQLLQEFIKSYGYSDAAMIPALSHKFTALMLLHRYSNLDVQIRIQNWKQKAISIKDLENMVWGF